MSRPPKTGHREKFTPSLLDRLVDLNPGQAYETYNPDGLSLSEYLSCIQRDLQDLLNTRQHFTEEQMDRHEEAKNSLLVYGFPELNSVNRVNVQTRHRLASAIENAIRMFEPRLVGVRVVPLPNESSIGEVRFRVEALARAEPSPERVVFDTTLDLDRQECRVMGEQ